MTGLTIGIIGLALCAIMCGIGSGLGLKATGSAATGVIAEDPSKFSKVMVLALLPATQGIYGFVIAIMGVANLPSVANLDSAGILATATAAQITAQGWNVFWAVMPMTIGGAVSAYLQGRTAATAILGVGKKGEISSKALIFPAMIEFYALLGLAVSILLLNSIPVANVGKYAEVIKEAATVVAP